MGGLRGRMPVTFWTFVVYTLAISGIPLTAGFLGKLYVLLASVGARLWPLAVSLVVSSVVGLYYYLNIIVTMFAQPETEPEEAHIGAVPSVVEGSTLGVLAVLLVGLGVCPALIIGLIETVVANLS